MAADSRPRSPFLSTLRQHSVLRHRLILAGILLLAVLLRAIRLDFQPLWWDEGYSVWFAGQPLGDMIRLTAADIHPPLYYALLHLWTLALGLFPGALRTFSLFASLPAIPLAYLLGRDLRNHQVGLLAAFLVAINPFAIFYSQEVRMYGLATTFSLAALWTGWRWAQPQIETKQGLGHDWRWGAGYALSVAGGLYTLYLFALIPLAQTVWALLWARERRRAWLSALLGAAILYVPWVVYAGPKLLNYVAYKIVKDNDTPLGLLPYLGKHLSAFLVGHLEGSLAPLWPWALLLLLPLIVALLLSKRRSHPLHSSNPSLYLLLVLTISLAIGFIQQLRAPFIPDRFERVLLVAAPALWLLLALGLRKLWLETKVAAVLMFSLLVAANAASLFTFYTTPRYAHRDYRPLIATVQQNIQAGDSIVAIFPWQIGYFWAYWPAATRPPIIASPSEAWGDEVMLLLDERLSKGGVWFPEHLALGGLLESASEDYLGQRSYQLLNRWYGAETRLTAWTKPSQAATVLIPPPTPINWQKDITLSDATLQMEASRLYLELQWQGEQKIQPPDYTFSLWLTGPAGYRWAQRDVNPFAQPWPPLTDSTPPWRNTDRIALTLPVGLPPGDYELWAALLDGQNQPVPLAGPNPAPQAWLGSLSVSPQANRIATIPAQFPAKLISPPLTFHGYSRSDAPYLPGDDIRLSLFWETTAALPADYFIFVQLLDSEGKVVAGLEEPPLRWLPTQRWPLDIPIRSQHHLRIPAELPAGRYQLIAGLFDPQTGERVSWGRHDYISLVEIQTAERPHSFTPPHPQHPLALTLVGGHRLVGYDLVAGESAGSPINLILYWIPAGATKQRYSTFVHLLDGNDTIRAQSDSEPAQGAHPTTSWLAGEVIRDAHTLTLPSTLSKGPYRLEIGLYDPRTGERLPFVDARGEVSSDHIVLPLDY